MSKGAVGLTAGYWPEGVYRYLAAPGLSLDDGLIARPARRRANHPALIRGDRRLTYRELSEEVERAKNGIVACLEGDAGRVALLLRDSLALVTMVMGVLRAQASVLILNPTHSPPELGLQLARFGADLLVVAEEDGPAAGGFAGGVKTVFVPGSGPDSVSIAGLPEGTSRGGGKRARLDLRAPTFAIGTAGGGLVYYSQKSLIAGAVSWSAFVPVTADHLVLSLRPLYNLGGLYCLLPVLFRGGTCLLADQQTPAEQADSVSQHHPHHTILPYAEADKLYRSSHAPLLRALRERLGMLFVAVNEPFKAGLIKKLERRLGKPVLTLWGSLQTGPTLANHPSWHLPQAVGIPVSNVDVWPLNPADGKPLEVPWEAIEFGELGFKSPMAAVRIVSADGQVDEPGEDFVRSRLVASMDPNGLFYLEAKVGD